ncbi:MAG: VCBS repeat-containing protein [Muribaculaceae bacterium]|nr:VCBS repeat-containing protein [Muribaculaceae bacterium]
MKKIYSALMLSAVAMTGLTANGAKPDWEHPGSWQLFEQANQFRQVNGTRPIVADFNNDDRFDIYYGGQNYDDEYNKPGLWPYPFFSLMYIQQEDGNFKCLYNRPEYVETRQEEIKDGDGNPVLDGEGNPTYESKDYYRQAFPENGIIPGRHQNYAVFDYDNDGLMDMYVFMTVNSDDYGASYRDQLYFEQVGDRNCWMTCQLYHNNGDGTFTRIDEHGLPKVVRPDANADEAERLYNNAFAVGDYDRDGYIDIAICAKRTNRVSGESYRIAELYRNVNGTGKFERMAIAETKGGAWIEEQLGDPAIQLPEGEFLPISGNVKFADLNNDGWLDLLFTGYAPWQSVHDPAHPENINNVSRVYLNKDDGKGGRKFVDVTDASQFLAARSAGIDLTPNSETGYFDLYTGGYVDGGAGWIIRAYLNNADDGESGVYAEGLDLTFNGWDNADWKEDYRPWMRDFNADGFVDMYLDGVDNNNVFYGNAAGTFEKECDYMNVRDFAKDSGVNPADFNGDGRADIFTTGWCYAEGREYQYVRNQDSGGGWDKGAYMFENQHENVPEDLVAPANVHAKIEDGMLTVTWEDNDDLTCAYNVYIETPDRGIVNLVAANPVTGFVRNTTDRHVAVRPGVQSYSIPATAEKGYKVGVQALSLWTEKYSPFTWSVEDLSSVGSIAADNTNVKVTVNGDAVLVNADANADVQIVDMLGRTVATGVTNVPVNVAAKGVMIANVNGKAVKFVK